MEYDEGDMIWLQVLILLFLIVAMVATYKLGFWSAR